MRTIKLLPPLEIQKIAAGEVIERPANVVKELIENAIDAGASHIQIYIEMAGQQLIRIIDNGRGMSSEDAAFCFEHHATSKISSFDELSMCSTFGFRGEALSSIAAVSKIELITKTSDADLGTKIRREQNAQESVEIATSTGTDISVRDLFYNVPARKKFMKGTATEWRHISLLFQAFCFSYPQIHFSLYHDGKLIHNCPSVSSIIERIQQLWEHTIAQNMLPVENQIEGIIYEGTISNHQVAKYDRSSVMITVNNRWVKNHGLVKAITKGYLNVLPPDRFPAAVISLRINPAEIDINVHPRKEEIQFAQAHKVERHITQLVRNTLEQQVGSHTKLIKKDVFTESIAMPSLYSTFAPLNQSPFINQIVSSPVQFSSLPINNETIVPAADTVIADYQYLGTFSATYLLFQYNDQLIIIDQHAAHERILYEKFKSRDTSVAPIELLFPQKIDLSRTELQQLSPYLDAIEKHGLSIELFDNSILIRAVPVYLKETAFDSLIKDILAIIVQNNQLDYEEFMNRLHEQIRAQMACKAAVKAGDILCQEKIKQLINDLHKTDNRFVCPHGRPTTWVIERSELEKKFKRKQ